MAEKIYLNNDWGFTEEYSDDLLDKNYDQNKLVQVRIPHTCKELPANYCDEYMYQMVSGYRKKLFVPEEWKGQKVVLTFDGIGHESFVYLNGELVGEHHCGYTAFSIDISEKVIYEQDNIITVKVDSRENINIPPFGFVIDYMTYGGIYRDVYIDVLNKANIEDVFVRTVIDENDIADDGSKASRALLKMDLLVSDEALDRKKDLTIYTEIKYNDRAVEGFETALEDAEKIEKQLSNVSLWSIDNPCLYDIKIRLKDGENILHEKLVEFGFRRAEFKTDGFYLNGKKVKIRGLNRHQSYPYVGYAMPESMQKYDADILKNELGVNAVRTSHYPQSQYFIDRCDELGLLVFTEIPGWQHIGDEEWKKQAVENVRDMVLQYRNHPSIILWGVRINESADDDEFYTRTNQLAHELDDSRQTGGVRCIKNSSLLEDVYTYNDFIHNGVLPGCDKKANVTSDMNKPYMVTEYNGHMYPTKPFDCESHRVEHAIRHTKVLDAVAGEGDIAGSFGWCMFDYNTHKDFGSGDRVCYHGVLDMFRNPKLAACVYSSQQEKTPVLKISSTMDVGEHPACIMGEQYIFTNADSVRMYKNDQLIKEYDHSMSEYKNLKFGPIRLEGFGGDWGQAVTTYRFEAVKAGQLCKTVNIAPVTKVKFKLIVSHTSLREKQSYDVAEIRIQTVDENHNPVYYFNEPVEIKASGQIEIIGPEYISLKGGMGAVYVKTLGIPGKGCISICNPQAGTYNIEFDIIK